MKKVIRLLFLYILGTSLLWMFSVAYSNSYNRLNYEKIAPAGIVINDGKVTVSVLHDEVTVDFGFLSSDSRFYYVLRFLSPDSVYLAEKVLIKAVGSIV